MARWPVVAVSIASMVLLAACVVTFDDKGTGDGEDRGKEARLPQQQLVIAHRGASGYLPEHTLEAYATAHAMGADYIEPDLVLTRDAVFICLHDIHLESTTNVEEVFPDRHREDGRWYAADFDLAEIKTLRAHERLEGRFPQQSAARFDVPTFQEMIELVQGLNRTTGREAGIYPELKAPAWHRENGLPMEERFLELVQAYGYAGPDAAIFVQCFEPEPLERLRELGSRLPHVFLVGGLDEDGNPPAPDPLANDGLDRIRGFANGIGPDKTRLTADPSIVERAHQRALLVHPYTFRADQLPEGTGSLEDELEHFYRELRVDALFTDFPDRARRFLDR